MKQKALGTFIVSAVMLATALINTTAHAKTTESTNQFRISPVIESTDTMHPELAQQLKSRKGGSIRFWEAVAWCETNHDWDDHGHFAGGLGMAKSVWVNYGGRQFASTPQKATKQQQIIIANRVAFFGFQTKNIYRTLEDRQNNKPYFRPAVGWKRLKNWGRGCVNWETRKPSRDRYTEQGMAEWKKSRNPSAGVSKSGLSGTVSSQSVDNTLKRCPKWEKKLKQHGLVPVKKFSAIMWRESRCKVKVIGWNYHKGMSHRDCRLAPASIYRKCPAVRSYDSGLLQVNSSWKTVTAMVCGTKYGDMTPLLTVDCNMKVSKFLLDNGGFAHWSATSGSNR
jgi:hypothetical protein